MRGPLASPYIRSGRVTRTMILRAPAPRWTGPVCFAASRSQVDSPRSRVRPGPTAVPRPGSGLQDGAGGDEAGLGVAPQGDRVLDNVAQTAPDLVLILSREGLRPARRGAETTPAEPSSPPRSRRSAGQGGDDARAACDEPAAQPGGGLRAAARWSGRSRGRVRASPAAPLASGPGAPEDAAEGGGV